MRPGLVITTLYLILSSFRCMLLLLSSLDLYEVMLKVSPPPLHYIIVARSSHTSVVLSDGSVLVMGGLDATNVYKNDVWKSVDRGASWTVATLAAGWTGMESKSYRCHFFSPFL
jgi:hypothetical protein